MRGFVRRSMRSVSVALVVCMIWVSAAAAAAPVSSSKPDVSDEIISLATTAAPYVVRNEDGTYTLTVKAKDLGVSQEAFHRFSKALDGINGAIRQGYLTSDSNGDLHATESGSKPQDPGTESLLPCVSYSVRLTEAQTIKVEALLNMIAAGTAGVAALSAYIATVAPPSIPVTAITGLVSGIIAAGAWFFASWMQYVDSGNGDTIVWGICSLGVLVPYVYPVGN